MSQKEAQERFEELQAQIQKLYRTYHGLKWPIEDDVVSSVDVTDFHFRRKRNIFEAISDYDGKPEDVHEALCLLADILGKRQKAVSNNSQETVKNDTIRKFYWLATGQWQDTRYLTTALKYENIYFKYNSEGMCVSSFNSFFELLYFILW